MTPRPTAAAIAGRLISSSGKIRAKATARRMKISGRLSRIVRVPQWFVEDGRMLRPVLRSLLYSVHTSMEAPTSDVRRITALGLLRKKIGNQRT